jgi:hypothetical protein
MVIEETPSSSSNSDSDLSNELGDTTTTGGNNTGAQVTKKNSLNHKHFDN